jgi:hypothetical protein
MNDIFSTRELATGLWALAIIIWVFAHKGSRKSASGVIKIALSRHLLIPTIFIFIYACGFTLLFSRLPLWEWI